MPTKHVQTPHQRLRTANKYNLHLVNADNCDLYGMPTLKPTTYTPKTLTGWSESNKTPAQGEAIHFFTDDYRFESIWNTPERYTQRVAGYDAALTPDFSLYTDMPIPMQIWNVYRSRAIGNYWQRQGITVIPTLQWSTPDSYVFSLNGLPERATVAVSTVGVRQSTEAKQLWLEGMQTALHHLNPATVLHFGETIDGVDWQNTNLIKYEHNMARRFENGRKRIAERSSPDTTTESIRGRARVEYRGQKP